MSLSRDRAHWNRHVGRSERHRADLCNRSAGQLGEQRQRVEITGFALIDRHTDGGVALQMLDRNKVFTHRQFYVSHRDVMREINPLPAGVSSRGNPDGGQVVAVDC